jgi:hypothetical protein
MPLSLDIGGLGAECAHSHEPSRVSPDGWRPHPAICQAWEIRNADRSNTYP